MAIIVDDDDLKNVTLTVKVAPDVASRIEEFVEKSGSAHISAGLRTLIGIGLDSELGLRGAELHRAHVANASARAIKRLDACIQSALESYMDITRQDEELSIDALDD